MKFLENIFESILWNSRLFVIFAVVFGLIGAISLIFVASAEVIHVVGVVWSHYVGGAHFESFIGDVVGGIIEAVDLYLIGVVLLIFAFGLYELFISDIDIAKEGRSSKILEVHSLDELKDKLAKVIVMVLVVTFFQKVMHMNYAGPLEMLYLAGSILALSLGLYFLHKGGGHE